MGGGLAHQQAHQLVPRERVEVGHRLVQEQQFGPLAQGEGERDPGALAAGEGADPPVRVQVAAGHDPARGVRVPVAGVEVGAHAQRLGDRELLVQRLVLVDEADPGAGGGRVGAEHADRALGGCEQSGGEREERGLAGAVGSDDGAHASGGQPEGTVAQRPGAAAEAFAEGVRLEGRDGHDGSPWGVCAGALCAARSG